MTSQAAKLGFPSAEEAALEILTKEIGANPARESQEEQEAEAILEKLHLDDHYLLIDVGANLTNRKFSRDLDNVLQRCKNAGLKKIIVTASTLQNSRDALRLTRLYPSYLYCTIGIHPHDSKSWNEELRISLKELASNPECVAIGECGLDYNKNFSSPEEQLFAFEKQVQLACEVNKPLYIHEREAHQDVVKILMKYIANLPPVLIHCFTGTKEEALKYLDLGCYIGLSGYVWKDKCEHGIRKILEEGVIPLDRLLLETDSPFMYPNPRASKLPNNIKEAVTSRSMGFLQRYCTFQRNEPCSLAVIVEMVAACLRLRADDVALKTTYTALRVFGLSG